MSKKKIAIIMAVIAVAAVIIYASIFKALYKSDEADIPADVIGSVTEENGAETDKANKTLARDEAVFNNNVRKYGETVISTEVSESESNTATEYDPYELLFGSKNTESEAEAGLLADVKAHDMSALTCVFDNIELKPGMYVRDIIDTTYWHTVRENVVLQPNESAYLCLDNDFWSDEEVKLVDKIVMNGNVTLWVHNYSSEPAEIRDCVIYKYQISYLGCYDSFSERPVLNYRDKYYLGYTGDYDTCDETTSVTLDKGDVTRRVYGDDSDCQVIMDSNDDGLMVLTVTYNIYFGPNFGGE